MCKVNFDADVTGTSKAGVLNMTFASLVEKLGYPEHPDFWDGKVRVRWILEHNDRVMTIYDWKKTCPVEDVTEWSVGGRSTQDWVSVVQYVQN